MNNNKYKILVIEDENNIRTFITALLEANNFQAISAESCKSGQLMFNSHRPDLVILDLGLPDCDGTEFIRGTAVQNGTTVSATTNRTAVKATLRYMTADELYFENGTTATYDVTTVTTSDANTDTFTFTLPSDATMFYVTFEDSDGNHTSTVLYDVK